MAARNADIGAQLENEIKAAGGTSMFVKTDVSNAEDIQRMVRTGVDKFGRLDILVNNAGMQPETHAPTRRCHFRRLGSRYQSEPDQRLPRHEIRNTGNVESGGGSIINVSSAGGLVGFMYSSAYCASKAGVINMTKATALEYAAQGIKVNAICPGVVWTPMVEKLCTSDEMRGMLLATTPTRQFGQPEEVAALALLLASGEVPFCTGAPFIIDGGMVAQ